MDLEPECKGCPYIHGDCDECIVDKIRDQVELIKEQVVGYTVFRRELSKGDEYDVIPIVQSDHGAFLSVKVKKRQKYVNTIPAPDGVCRVSMILPSIFGKVPSQEIKLGYQYELSETDFESEITSQIKQAILSGLREVKDVVEPEDEEEDAAEGLGALFG